MKEQSNKILFSVIETCELQARGFVAANNLQPSLMFLGKTGAPHNGPRCMFLVLGS
jgi:hypothetical protein